MNAFDAKDSLISNGFLIAVFVSMAACGLAAIIFVAYRYIYQENINKSIATNKRPKKLPTPQFLATIAIAVAVVTTIASFAVFASKTKNDFFNQPSTVSFHFGGSDTINVTVTPENSGLYLDSFVPSDKTAMGWYSNEQLTSVINALTLGELVGQQYTGKKVQVYPALGATITYNMTPIGKGFVTETRRLGLQNLLTVNSENYEILGWSTEAFDSRICLNEIELICNIVLYPVTRQKGLIMTEYNNGYKVSLFNKEVKNVNVPATYNGKAVIKIADEAFIDSDIETVFLPDTIKEIGERAFASCQNLKAIYTDSSVQTQGIFYMPQSLEVLGECAFINTNASEIVMEQGLRIGDYAFQYCESLEVLSIPSGSIIGTGIAKGCTILSDITLPYSIKLLDIIENSNRRSPIRINILSGTEIVEEAFYGISDELIVTLPSTITRIGESAFKGAIIAASPNFVLPEGLLEVGREAFFNCKISQNYPPLIESLTIPTSIRSFGSNCFAFSGSYGTISISSEAEIGSNAFRGTSIEKLILPTSLRIDNIANYDNDIKEIEILGGREVVENAFFNCPSLIKVTLPNTITTIGQSAFAKNKLQYLSTSTKEAEEIGDFVLPNDLTAIDDYGFYMTNVKRLIGTNSLEKIGMYAFSDCYALSVVTGLIGVQEIGNSAFASCPIKRYNSDIDYQMHLSNELQKIGRYAFFDANIIDLIAPFFGYDRTTASSGNSEGEGVFGRETFNLLQRVELTDCEELKYLSFYNMKNLKELILPEGLKVIGRMALYNITGLTNLIIPATVTKIDKNALGNCASLVDLELPEGLIEIGEQALTNCNSLTSLFVPQSVQTLGREAFAYCEKLAYVEFEKINDVPIFMTMAAQLVSGGTIILMPDQQLFELGELRSNSSFSTLLFGSGMKKGDYIIEERGNDKILVKYLPQSPIIYIAADITMIGTKVFYSKTALREIVVDSANSHFKSVSGVLYNFDKTMLIKFPSSSPLSHFDIDAATTVIFQSAFEGAEGLKSLTMPSVYLISNSAFYGCKNLATINSNRAGVYNLNMTQGNIGSRAFENTGAIEINFVGVEYIGSLSFMGCHNLTKINLGSVIAIGESAFSNCSKLIIYALPSNLQSLGTHAFYNTLTYNQSEGGVMYLDNWAIGYKYTDEISNSSLVTGTISIREGTEHLVEYLFAQCGNLSKVILPDSLLSIGRLVFSNCTSLSSINSSEEGVYIMPSQLKSIGAYSFRGCESMREIFIDKELEYLDTDVFYNCENLTTIHFKGGEISLYSKWNEIANNKFADYHFDCDC